MFVLQIIEGMKNKNFDEIKNNSGENLKKKLNKLVGVNFFKQIFWEKLC